MNAKKGLTRTEVIVLAACLVILVVNIQAISTEGRIRAKRQVCMANLKTLTAAWQMYAQSNNDKLVNGGPISGDECPPAMGCLPETECAAIAPTGSSADIPFYAFHLHELPWVGAGWGPNWREGIPAEECCQRCAMQTGALWKYMKNEKMYRCPSGNKGQMVTYSIVDSMNGKYMYSGANPLGTWGDLPQSMCAKSLAEINRASDRMVFIDMGHPVPDSYGVYYYIQSWLDLPAARHNNGTCASFADGHAGHITWKAGETVEASKGINPQTGQHLYDNYTPVTCEGKNDL